MKYVVVHSILLGAEKSFKRDEEVTATDLTDAGFDVEFLLRNGAIEGLRGTGGPTTVTPAADLSGGKPGQVRPVAGAGPNVPGRPAAGDAGTPSQPRAGKS